MKLHGSDFVYWALGSHVTSRWKPVIHKQHRLKLGIRIEIIFFLSKKKPNVLPFRVGVGFIVSLEKPVAAHNLCKKILLSDRWLPAWIFFFPVLSGGVQ